METKKIAIVIFIILAFGMGGYYFYTKDSDIQPLSNGDVMILTSAPIVDKNTDFDKDGLPDALEKVISTEIDKTDTDSDTYNDLAEIKNGYDPLVAGSTKLSAEEWQTLKDKIKAADKDFYEKNFGTSDNEMLNWKIYNNKEYGFEIKYPNNWETIENTPAIMSFVKTADLKIKNPEEMFIIQIKAADRKPEISFIDQIKGKTGNNPELRKTNGKDFYYAKNQLSGITFYEYSLEHKNKIYQLVGIIFLKLPDNIVNESDIVYTTDEELSEELSVLSKMASAFTLVGDETLTK